MGTGTNLGRVRGLGSARSGTGHFWHSRVSAMVNLVMMAWFATSLLRLPNLDFEAVTEWLHAPLAAIPMLLLIASVFYHLRLGLQVAIEDYVHSDGNKVLAIMALNLFALGGVVTAAFCVLKIAFGAAS